MVQVGTIVWLASELMFFAGLFAIYFTLRSTSPELWADRTYAAREHSAALDRMRFQPDQWVSQHPRLAGGLVLAGSAFVLFSLGVQPWL